MQNEVSAKKGSGFWKFVKIALIVAAVAFVAYKIYQKFFKKKIEVVGEAEDEDIPAVAAADEVVEDTAVAEEAPFEVSADAVIDNAENMN